MYERITISRIWILESHDIPGPIAVDCKLRLRLNHSAATETPPSIHLVAARDARSVLLYLLVQISFVVFGSDRV